MKTIDKPTPLSILKLAFLAVLLLTFSCSPDTVLQENLEAANAKSKAKNDKKSLNAVLKTLVKGSPLAGANGLDVGPDGHLYVASVNDQEIIVMNKNNGKIIERIGDDVEGPDDLVFGPDGSLYWTDILSGYVKRRAPNGDVTEQFVANGVNPITFSPDGRLFVALDFLGDGLYELDPDLDADPRPIVVCSDPLNPFCLGFFNSFNVGPDGRLYGPLFALNLVISVNVDPTNPVTSSPFTDTGLDLKIVAGSFVDSEFNNPAAAKFGPDGMLYVLDQAGKVFKINTETGNKTLFTTLQPGLDNMAFDDDGTLYMTNNDEGWVAEILPSGQARIISPGGIILPQGLAVLAGPNNQDIVFEADLFQLRQFNGTSGRQENSYKGFLVPEGPESLILPMNLSTDGENLIVSSWFSGAVQVFNPHSGHIQNVPLLDPSIPPFPTVPIDAIGFKDNIVVSDFQLGGVFLASKTSYNITPILLIDDETVFAPGGLATDGQTVWVADWGTGIIWQIGFEGITPNTPQPIVFDLVNPEGLAFDNAGGLLVVEAGASRLSRIDLSIEPAEVTTIVEDLDLRIDAPVRFPVPPMWFFDGVAVGPSGDIYVSGSGAKVVYKIKQKKGKKNN